MNPKRFGMVFALFMVATTITVAGFSVNHAHAYSSDASDTPGPATPSFNGSVDVLLAPFESFIQTLNTSMGGNQNIFGSPVNNPPSMPSFDLQNINLQNGPQQLDQWFTSTTGLSLSSAFKLILQFILWALSLTQQFIQWLIGLFH